MCIGLDKIRYNYACIEYVTLKYTGIETKLL